MFGRNGECPVPVIAARSPADCFDVAHEAWRIAVRYMTPVILLTDGYIANGAEPWRIPDVDKLPQIDDQASAAQRRTATTFMPYARDERLARPWAMPGTPGLMHRIGGLEKQDITGNVNYEPDNHEHMVNLRASKVADIANDIPPQEVDGPASGKLLVLSWGGTYGACATAVREVPRAGRLGGAHAHLRYLNPFPAQPGRDPQALRESAGSRAEHGPVADADPRPSSWSTPSGLNKVQGKPFAVSRSRAEDRSDAEELTASTTSSQAVQRANPQSTNHDDH